MASRYDVIVIGVGGMGSAACYHLARRGKKVLGIERFGIPHDRGSSHGLTRIIRLAYFEHPSYVPLLQRAFELWGDLQQQAGETLLKITGSIDAGPPGSELVRGSLESCKIHHLRHEVLGSRDVSERFPGYRLPPQHTAVFQPDGGFLLSEKCIEHHVRLAEALGAEIHAGEQVRSWEPTGFGVRVETDRGRYEAERIVFAVGAWLGKLLEALAPRLRPERQVVMWFQTLRPDRFEMTRFPVFNLSVDEGHYYGFPSFGVPGFKIGRYHHRGETVDPDQLDREIHPEDEQVLRACVDRYFPEAAGPMLYAKTCLFTNTPDEHFVIDLHPQFPQVVIASPCSGHGFKFASVIGEVLADLATGIKPQHDICMFRVDRFSRP